MTETSQSGESSPRELHGACVLGLMIPGNYHSMEDKHERLRDWYLAHLRRKAIERRSVISMTPSSLVRADRQKFEQLISEANRELADSQPARPLTFIDEHAPRAQQIQSLCIVSGVICLTLAVIHSSSRSGILAAETVVITETALFVGLLTTLVLIFLRARQTAAVRSLSIQIKPELTSQIGLDQTTDLHQIAQRLADALEKSLQKERAIADYSPHFICSIDKEYRFIALGPSSFTLTGFLPQELCGAPLSMLVNPEDLRDFTRFLQQSVVSDIEIAYNSRIRTKNGEKRELSWITEWSEAEQAFYCVAENVSGQREVQLVHKQMAEMLSQEIRSPLAAVKTALGLMVMGTYGTMPDPAQEQLEKSLQTVNRLIQFLQQTAEREREQSQVNHDRQEQASGGRRL